MTNADRGGVLIRGPQIGIPAGQKPVRADFTPENVFSQLIETKGLRVAWSRAAACPCDPTNSQTRQPDPNCALCKGRGFLYFRPVNYAVPDNAGILDDLQRYILEKEQAVIIKGITTSVERTQETYSQIGEWISGSVWVTVRRENHVGHYDRMVWLDADIPYTEIVIVGEDPLAPLGLRYPATAIELLRTVDRVYEEDSEYVLNSQGLVEFVPSTVIAAGDRLAVHYLHHPVALVWDHSHIFRQNLNFKKKRPSEAIAPEGDPLPQPIQVMARLEYLIK
jgi:hypothetical protein